MAYAPHLFWDGRAETLEEQARQPVVHPREMGHESETACAACIAALPEYPPLFERAFGDARVTMQRIARALAAYERTLLAGDAPFDRWWRGDAAAMGEPARRGYRVFIDRGGCVQCHSIRQSYALFTDYDFHNTGAGKGAGVADTGRMGVTGREEDRGAFRTPTLRNVALTAPYMHDGSLATLEEVIDFYVEGGRQSAHLSPLMRPLDLDEADRADLLAFLHALTSPELPRLAECDRLLAEGRPKEAMDAFLREAERSPDDWQPAAGAARAALALDDASALGAAERLLRARIATLSPDRAADGAEPVATLLFLLGKVHAAQALHEEVMAIARHEDAIAAWRRIRIAGGTHEEATALEALLHEHLLRPLDALAALDDALGRAPRSTRLRETKAGVLYRRAWAGFPATDTPAADFAIAAALLDALMAEGVAIGDESALYRAYAHHRLGNLAAARTAYADAIGRDQVAEKALRGLRNLLARDLATWRTDLASLRDRNPDSPAVLLFAGWEALEQGRTDEAIRDLRRRVEVEATATASPHYYLARALRDRDRTQALDHYAVAFALDPAFPKLAAEYETFLRSRPLGGFADVDALVAEYRQFLDAGPDDPRFQALARNNLAFTLRDVAASFTSRGPARIHTFAEGAPEKAREILRTSLAVYEEACALVPADVMDLPFAQRWEFAAVLNDTGLVLHYFRDVQDLARAEALYLRAFDLTGGAYQDAYFYNLQFLYGFELSGREERWYELARVAKDAILREDPARPGTFEPDAFKRTAARRDFERLSAALRR